jgi:hypothetical protein
MATEQPDRVRVVLAEAAKARAPGEGTRVEIAEQTGIGEALVRGLIRTQLALALRCAGAVAFGLGSLPLLFALVPPLARLRPWGVSLPWLLLGVAAYPFVFLVGWAFVHLAERTERDFVDLVERP